MFDRAQSRLAARADGENLKSMPDGLPAEFAADSVAQQHQFLAAELNASARLHAHHAVTRLAPVEQFVVRLLGVEERLGDDARVEQQSERAIHRRLRDIVRAGTQVEQQFLGLERAVTGDDRVKDVRAFLGVLQVVALEEPAEDRAQRRERLHLRCVERFGKQTVGIVMVAFEHGADRKPHRSSGARAEVAEEERLREVGVRMATEPPRLPSSIQSPIIGIM